MGDRLGTQGAVGFLQLKTLLIESPLEVNSRRCRKQPPSALGVPENQGTHFSIFPPLKAKGVAFWAVGPLFEGHK